MTKNGGIRTGRPTPISREAGHVGPSTSLDGFPVNQDVGRPNGDLG